MTMLRTQATILAPLVLALALAACGEETATETEEGEAEATGEVLEGTISDDMLPVEELRSQPPQADPEPAEGDRSGGSSGESAAPAPQETAEPEIQPVPGIEIAEPEGDEGEGAE